MRRIIGKSLSFVLAIIMLLSVIAVPVNAEDTYNDSFPLENEVSTAQEKEDNVIDNTQDVESAQDFTDDVEQNTVDPEVRDGEISDNFTSKNGQTTVLNYIYVESPYLRSPGTENIVLSWGDGFETVSDVKLNVQKDDGTIENWNSYLQNEQLFLFTKDFSDETYTGTYSVIGVNYLLNNIQCELLLSDLGAEAKFGVNCEYEGYEPQESVLEVGESADAENVEATVMTIDETGNVAGEEELELALSEAEDANIEGQVAMFSLGRAVSNVEENSKSPSNIVVALDAGHDSKDAGANYNGLAEEILTLKIANYCKQELEKYSGVTVYMTRTSSDCPVGITTVPHAGACIDERVRRAAEAGAKIFVSLHLNASVISSAHGAEVIIPNPSWKPEQYTQGKELAEKIVNELTALGLAKRSIYYKDTTIDEKYPDESTSDYFTAQCAGKEYGVPALIVEHAFISNVGNTDQSLLTSESGLQKLGVADATAIAKYLGLSEGTWKEENGKLYYYLNNQKVYGEMFLDGAWRYFDESTGAMATGWTKHHNHQYYYDENGCMQYGEKLIDGKWYYFDEVTGVMQTGWVRHHNHQYYYNASGVMQYGKQTINDKYYYFDGITGVMKTGFVKIDGQTYYYLDKAEGICLGEKLINGKWYYFDEKTGVMATGWTKHHNHQYYYDKNGCMQYGEQLIGGKWYYFDEITGVMQTDEKLIDGSWYYFDEETGVMATGWTKHHGYQYYYDTNGHMQYGEKLIDGFWYYFDEITGVMATGWSTHHGHKYYYSSEGKMQYGYQKIGGKGYWFDTITGILQGDIQITYGEQKIGNDWYYFDEETGEMATGWSTHHGHRYYYSQEGKMQYGEKLIEGFWYYFDEITGVMATGWSTHHGHRYYYSPEGKMQYGEKKINGNTYYFDRVTGVMATGWNKHDGHTYYYSSEGKMQYDEKLIDGSWYYFDKVTGAMATDWTDHHNNRYYYSLEGKMQYGEKLIDGSWYYFDEITGVMATGWTNHHGNRYYYSSEGKMQYGLQTIDGVEYYFNPVTGILEPTIEILGASARSDVDRMVSFYRTMSPVEYPEEELGKGGAPTLEELCMIYYEEACDEGVRADVAFCQAMIETGWLKFDGSVSIDKFNFAGLGAVDSDPEKGSNSFKNVRAGVRAQIQHLKAYASSTITEDTLAHPCEDARFSLVSKGSAPYVEMLGGRWASDKMYGYNIAKLVRKM